MSSGENANGCHMLLAGFERVLIALLLLGAAPAIQGQSARERAQAARQLFVSGKFDEAVNAYRALVATAPNDPDMLLNLAIAEYRAKRYADSIRHGERAAQLRPDLPAAPLFIGASYLQMGAAEKAAPYLEKAVARMPQDRNARLMFAEALLLSERYDDAVVQFRSAGELLPNNPRVQYGLGQAYDALAERTAAQIQSESPSSAEAYAVAGDINAQHGRFAAAFTDVAKALELNPAIAGAYVALARVYRATGHPRWAAEAEAADHSMSDAAGRNRTYDLYLTYRRSAMDAYAKLDRMPDSVEQHLHRAKSLDAQGRYTEAIGEWRKLVKAAPDDPRFCIGLAWSLFRRRDYEAVLSLTRGLLRADARSVEANFLSGAALLNLDRAEEAIPYLRAATESDRSFLPGQAALGQAMLRMGNAGEAIAHLVAAIPADSDGAVRFQLSRAYSKTGQDELARKTLREYQAFRSAREQALAREERVRITPLGRLTERVHEP